MFDAGVDVDFDVAIHIAIDVDHGLAVGFVYGC